MNHILRPIFGVISLPIGLTLIILLIWLIDSKPNGITDSRGGEGFGILILGGIAAFFYLMVWTIKMAQLGEKSKNSGEKRVYKISILSAYILMGRVYLTTMYI